MNSQETENLDLAILRVLDANRTRYGLQAEAIGMFVRSRFAVSATEDQIKDRLQYLSDKKLVEEAMKQINRANRCWRISEDGIAFVDVRSL